MSQPKWILIAQLGDASPIDHGGYFVYRDETGVYPEEAEYITVPEEDEGGRRMGGWTIHRFGLTQCTYIDGVLSDNDPAYPAWFADDIEGVASYTGRSPDLLRADFCSDDPIRRALAYRDVGECWGMDNLDQYPIVIAKKKEVEERYRGRGERSNNTSPRNTKQCGVLSKLGQRRSGARFASQAVQ